MAAQRRSAAAWPCRDYCARTDCAHCTRAAALEVVLSQTGRAAREEPVTRHDRDKLAACVLINIRDKSTSSPLMAGEEVDLLVTGLEDGSSGVQWRIFRFWLMNRTGEVDEEIIDKAMEKVLHAMLRRLFLLDGSMPRSRRDPATNAEPPFTHVFVFRAWATTIVKRKAIDSARRRKRELLLGEHAPEPVDTSTLVDEEHEDDVDRVEFTWLRVPELVALVERDHRKRPDQRGWMRAQHMRHTLARLPHRRVAELSARFPELGLDKLPAAHSDIEMAANLTEELSRAGLAKAPQVTPQNVHSTRSNYRVHIEARHPELAPALALVLLVALRQVDLQNWFPGEADQPD